MSKRIELDAPCLGALEKKYLCDAVDSGFVSSVGPFIPQFERAMADFLAAKDAVGVQSGTAALFMALHMLGLQPGDEVIVPALTFVATVNAVLYAGATPVIVDVDARTWNLSPHHLQQAITPRTKAIMPVHVYGNPCDMTAIMAIAKEHNIPVIEDATESLGALLQGRHMGTWGDFGCFSFNGNKMITTGGGGMIVGRDAQTIEDIRGLVNQAKHKERIGYHATMGFNYRMTNIEAALGLAQFEQLTAFLAKKKAFNVIYREALSPIGVHFQHTYTDAVHSFWLTCITVDPRHDVDAIVARLAKDNIYTRRIFMPIDRMPYLGRHRPCLAADEIYDHGLCVPSSVLNTEEDIRLAAAKICEVLDG